MRRVLRHSGSALIVAGVLVCLYAATILFWRDPVTDLYTAWKQHDLKGSLAGADRRYEAAARAVLPAADRPAIASGASAAGAAAEAPAAPDPAVVQRAVRRLADRFRAEYGRRDGAPIGRIQVPRLGLGTIFLQGTGYWPSLSKGPGHYGRTDFPGRGRTIAIAGHRTTFAAPFRHIDRLRAGDEIELRMPYGDFRYRVTGHRIVDDGDWSIIRETGHEQVVLSACHPLYSAAQRYVVFARLASVALPGARPVRLG